MKKILGLTVAAVLVMALVGGGTWAYFSDPETMTNNTFAAGTLDLTVNAENPWTTGAISILDLWPGKHSGNTTITATNSGNLEGDLWFRIRGVTPGEGDTSVLGASSEPEAMAGGYPTYVAVTNIDTLLTLNHEVDSVAAGLNNVTLNTANTTAWEKIKDNWTSGSVVIVLGTTLSSGADNNVQGDNCTFNIELFLTQTDDITALP